MTQVSALRFLPGLSILFAAAACGSSSTAVSGGFSASSGAGASTGAGGSTPDLGDVCAEHHTGTTFDGNPVVVCEKTFSTLPLVRPPADGAKLYLGVTANGLAFDRKGSSYQLDNASLGAFEKKEGNRALYTLYEIDGGVSAPVNPGADHALHVNSAKPVLIIRGSAIDGAYLQAFEGTASKRTGDMAYDESARVPIRVSFTMLDPLGTMEEWDDGKVKLPDGELYEMKGTVENLTGDVKSSDGSCIKATASLADGDPFFGAVDGLISMRRFPGMHLPGDDEQVLFYPGGTTMGSNDGMTILFLFHPAGFIQETLKEPFVDLGFYPHGPQTGSRIDLHPVSGGGGPCAP